MDVYINIVNSNLYHYHLFKKRKTYLEGKERDLLYKT